MNQGVCQEKLNAPRSMIFNNFGAAKSQAKSKVLASPAPPEVVQLSGLGAHSRSKAEQKATALSNISHLGSH